MQLIVWRTIGKNPCDNPPVKIIIASREKGTDIFPWVLPLGMAQEIFGVDVIDQIGSMPVEISLNLSFCEQEG